MFPWKTELKEENIALHSYIIRQENCLAKDASCMACITFRVTPYNSWAGDSKMCMSANKFSCRMADAQQSRLQRNDKPLEMNLNTNLISSGNVSSKRLENISG
jgi:hypothetical protein